MRLGQWFREASKHYVRLNTIQEMNYNSYESFAIFNIPNLYCSLSKCAPNKIYRGEALFQKHIFMRKNMVIIDNGISFGNLISNNVYHLNHVFDVLDNNSWVQMNIKYINRNPIIGLNGPMIKWSDLKYLPSIFYIK